MKCDYSNPDYVYRLKHLFSPGNGVVPPLLAGREEPLSQLDDFLQALTRSAAPPKDVILYGPRGNGKTVLLETFRQRCLKAGIQAVEMRPKSVNTPADAAGLLLHHDDDAMAELLDRIKPDSMALNLPGIGGVGWRRLSQAEKDQLRVRHLTSLLRVRCRRTPLLVCVDEAHTLGRDLGAHLLNVSELLRKGNAPFLLVMAGTPELRRRLGDMEASFWGRSAKVGIGRLGHAATEAALANPLARLEIRFEPLALQKVVCESQRYPFFIQVWGKALCHVLCATKADRITPEILEKASPQVEFERQDYYLDRFHELVERDLLPASMAVGTLYSGGESQFNQAKLQETLLASGAAPTEQEAREQLHALSALGYIWNPPPLPVWEPGIPSLMSYVLEHGGMAD